MTIHSVFVLVVVLSTIIGSDGKLNPVKHVKPGTCPVPPKGLLTHCIVKCSGDDVCPGYQKCCNYGCTVQCMEPVKDERICYYNGKTYKEGDRFMLECNRCFCHNGRAACTRMACPPKSRTCYHNGKKYKEGDRFMDKCNRCFCRSGLAVCTKMFCPPPSRTCYHNGKKYKEGESFMDECNRCFCRNGNVACTEMACLSPNKPGTCPVAPEGLMAPCVVKCFGDDSCPGTQKCCNYGCTVQCMEPVKKAQPDTCPVPPKDLITPCVVKCSEDDDCPGTKKCCNYGCSIQCMEPVKKGLV